MLSQEFARRYNNLVLSGLVIIRVIGDMGFLCELSRKDLSWCWQASLRVSTGSAETLSMTAGSPSPPLAPPDILLLRKYFVKLTRTRGRPERPTTGREPINFFTQWCRLQSQPDFFYPSRSNLLVQLFNERDRRFSLSLFRWCKKKISLCWCCNVFALSDLR